MQETRVQSLGWEDPLEKEWQPAPVFLPGKSHGWRSLAGYSPWGRKESDFTFSYHSPVLEGSTSWSVLRVQRVWKDLALSDLNMDSCSHLHWIVWNPLSFSFGSHGDLLEFTGNIYWLFYDVAVLFYDDAPLSNSSGRNTRVACPPPGDLSNTGIKPTHILHVFLHGQAGSLEPPGKPACGSWWFVFLCLYLHHRLKKVTTWGLWVMLSLGQWGL